MWACEASWELHKLIPVISCLLAATPILLKVVENCISRMIIASSITVFIRNEWALLAAFVRTYKFPILCHLKTIWSKKPYNRVLWCTCLCCFLCLFGFLLFLLFTIEVCSCFKLCNALFLKSIWGIGNCTWLPKLRCLLFFIWMWANAATLKLFEFCPLVSHCLTARPTFF